MKIWDVKNSKTIDDQILKELERKVGIKICPKCKVTWPALTTLDAYRKHLTANKVHPGKKCEEYNNG